MSDFIVYDFDLTPHDVAQVTLSGCESDVFLVDYSNLCAFKRRGQFTYYGGHYQSSPVRLSAPYAGRWYLVVEPTGGSVQASAKVFKNVA